MKMLNNLAAATWKITLAVLPWVLLLLAVFLFPATFARCTTFKPVIIEGEPERSDFYTSMKFYAQGGKDDSAFIGTVYSSVQQADARKRAELETAARLDLLQKCKQIYYGDSPVDKKEYDKFLLYTECIGKQ